MNETAIAGSLSGGDSGAHWKAGATIFRQGDPPDAVYLLRSGKVDLIFESRSGAAKPLRVAGPGQILGLSSVVMGQPHDCWARTRTACEISVIQAPTFLAALQSDPAAWMNVLGLLSGEVNAAYDDMRKLSGNEVILRSVPPS